MFRTSSWKDSSDIKKENKLLQSLKALRIYLESEEFKDSYLEKAKSLKILIDRKKAKKNGRMGNPKSLDTIS